MELKLLGQRRFGGGTATTHPNLPNVPNGTEGIQPTPPQRWVEEEVSYTIIGCFFWVYNTLGYGFLESIYARALEVALRLKGLKVEREVPVTVFFEGVEVGRHRMDMIVEDRIILEIKSTEKLTEVPKRQLKNYLSATDNELGLVLHFGPQANYYRILRKKKAERSLNHSANSENSDE
jgi:GxxExxY protein